MSAAIKPAPKPAPAIQCPKCSHVDRTGDALCHRCGAILQPRLIG